MDRTLQWTCRVRLELPMVAALERQGNAIAERPQQIRGPRSQRDHDMARRDRAVRERHAPALAVGHDRLDVRLADRAARPCEHPRIGLDHGARRVDRGRLRVQQADLVDRQDVRLQRGNAPGGREARLSMPYSARKACSAFAAATASLRQAFSQPVSRMRCAASALTIHSRCSFSDAPISPCRAVGPRLEARRRRIGEEADDPVEIADGPGRIPAQRGVPVGEVTRQRAPQRRLVERHDRAAGENAGIAIGGFAARLAPVDEDHRQAALPRRKGRRHADDARAEHDDIRLLGP